VSNGVLGPSVGASTAEDARNRVFGAGKVDDPYPRLSDLRQECPIHRGSIPDQFPEMADTRPPVPVGRQTFSTFDYELGTDVLRRADEFASGPFYHQMSESIGVTVIAMEEPEHRRMRLLVQPAFARREMDRWKERIIQPIVDEHLDRIAPVGRADLYNELGSVVPVHTISAALGLPVEDRGQFFDWAIAMASVAATAEERAAASDAVAQYIAPIISSRRAEPRDDLLTTLVRATVPLDEGVDADRRPLSNEEINSFVRLFIIAGSSTTYRSFGLLMFHLLSNPDQLEAVNADRSLVSRAIHEALRIDQPLTYLARVSTTECELGGVTIPENSLVEVSLGGANHDPEHFAEPDLYDIHRPVADRHITFGFGIHRCVGAHLAEAELSIMLERCLDRLPGLRLDPESTDVHMTGLGFRLPTRLPVVFSSR